MHIQIPSAPSDVLEVLLEAARRGINHGQSGNASIRSPGGMLITPSGRNYSELTSEELIFVAEDGRFEGRPSSEWQMHQGVYRARPDARAIVHLHSPAATALATLRLDLPAFHYMVAMAGGDHVRCAAYALFGTPALADAAVRALGTRDAVLLANHGQLTCGTTPWRALELATELEGLCDSYLRARAVGEPVLLTAQEMREVHARFATYRKVTLQPGECS